MGLSSAIQTANSVVNRVSGQVVGAFNAETQFRQMKADISHQQDIHRYNARLYEREMRRIDAETNENDERMRREGETERGSIRAAYGASGLVLSGSPLEYLSEAAAAHEMEALDARRAGRLASQEMEQRAYMERYQADTVLAAQKDLLKKQRMTSIGMSVADSLGAFGLDNNTMKGIANGISSGAFAQAGRFIGSKVSSGLKTVGGWFK